MIAADVLAKAFSAADHPRDDHGRFVSSDRWDEDLPQDPHHAREVAKKAAGTMQMQVDALESMGARRGARERAQIRKANGALYYDLHRARRLADASDRDVAQAHARHVRTKDIASDVSTGRFRDPKSTADYYDKLAHEQGAALPEDSQARQRRIDAMLEHLLYEHSIDATGDLASWLPWRHMSAAALHLLPRAPGEQFDEQELNDAHHALKSTFGDHSRSPKSVKLTFGRTRFKKSPILGHTLTDTREPNAGSMLLAWPDRTHGSDALAHEFAQSLAIRHLRPEFEAFNGLMRDDMRSRRNPHESLSAHGVRMQSHARRSPFDGKAGHYLEDWASALSHAVLGTRNTAAMYGYQHPHYPTHRAVSYAARVLGVHPKVDTAKYRGHLHAS